MAAASSGCLFLSKNDPAATWHTLGNNSGEESYMTSKKRYLRIALAAAFSAAKELPAATAAEIGRAHV